MLSPGNIDKLINTWLDYFLEARSEPGCPQKSLLGLLIEFKGAPPRGTGIYKSDSVMSAAAAAQKAPPPKYKLIDGVIRQMLRKRPLQIKALLVKHGYQGLNTMTGKTYTHADRAWILGTDEGSYKNALKSGYRSFSDIYMDLAEYEGLTG